MAIITKDIGDIMAEKSNNVDELNRISDDGRIGDKSDSKEQKEDVKKVAQGEKNISQVEQIIDVSNVEDVVFQNDMFTNMSEPCMLEGVNLLGELKKYFSEHKIKPEDLKEKVQERIEMRKNELNRTHPSLSFYSNGVIDRDRSIQKAITNKQPVAKYLQNVYSEEGKEIKLPEDNTLAGKFAGKFVDKLNAQSDSYFEYANKMIDEAVRGITIKMESTDFYKGAESVRINSGDEVHVNKSYSREANVFNAKIEIIKNNLGKILTRGKSDSENEQLIIEIVASYEQLLAFAEMDLKELGFSDSDIVLYKQSIEDAIGLAKQKFELCTLSKLNDGPVLNQMIDFIGKDRYEKDVSNERRKVDETAEETFEQYIGKEQVEISLEEEERKVNIIRMMKIYRAIEQGTTERKMANEDEWFAERKARINARYPELFEVVKDTYDNSDTVELYAQALIRQKILEDIEKLRQHGVYVDDQRNKSIDYKAEYSKIIPAIIALSRKADVQEDIDARNVAIEALLTIFPNVIGENLDFNNESHIKEIQNRIFNEIKKKYVPVFGQESMEGINNFEQLGKKLETRYAFKVKQDLLGAILDNEKKYDRVTKTIDNPSVKEYIRRENDKENKLLYENKLYISLMNDITKLEELKEREGLNKEQEIELLNKLAATYKIYAIDGENTKKITSDGKEVNYKNVEDLLLIIKRNLADIAPDVFTGKEVDDKKLENFVLYRNKNEKLYTVYKHDESKDSFLDFLADRVTGEVKDEIYFSERSLKRRNELKQKTIDTYAEWQKNHNIINSERYLKILHYISDESQKKCEKRYFERFGYQAKCEFRTKEFIELIEGAEQKYQAQVIKIYERDMKDLPEEERKFKAAEMAEKDFSFIEEHKFDDTIYPAIIREGKRKVINKALNPIFKKYDNNKELMNEELTDEEKKEIIIAYLGVLNDCEKEDLDFRKNTVRDIQNRLFKYLVRIDPNLVKDNKEIDNNILLEIYNDCVNSNFGDIEDAIIHAEDKVVQKFVEELGKDKEDKDIVSVVADEDFRSNAKIQDSQKRRNNFGIMQQVIRTLNKSLYTRNDINEGVKDDVDLIKGLYLALELYDGENLERKNLTDRNAAIQNVEKDLLEIAKDNLRVYFSDVITKDGRVKKDILKSKVEKYLRENDSEFGEKLDSGRKLVDIIREEIELENEGVAGPKQVHDIDREINNTQKVIGDYKKSKEKFYYMSMVAVMGKMRQKFFDGDPGGREPGFATLFDRKCPGLKEKIEKSEFYMDIDDSYVESAIVLGGKRQLNKICDKYFPIAEKGKKHTRVSEIPPIESLNILKIAIGTLIACENMKDYKTVTNGADALKTAGRIIKKFIPNGVKEVAGKYVFNDEALLTGYKVYLAKNGRKTEDFTVDKLKNSSYKRTCISVVMDMADDNTDKNMYFNIFDNSKLRSMIKSKQKDIEAEVSLIDNEEIEPVFESRAENVMVDNKTLEQDVSNIETKGKDDYVSTDVPITDKEASKVVSEKGEELHYDNSPEKDTEEVEVENRHEVKVEQQEDILNNSSNGIVAESINVAPVVEEKSMTVVEEKGFFASIIDKIKNVPEFVKNGINGIKDRLGIGQSSSSNNTETSSTSTSSTGGVVKTEQDVVQNLTGYGQQILDLNAAKAPTQNETGKKVGEKGNELEGNEENERD